MESGLGEGKAMSKGKGRHVLYLFAAVGMLVYAVPEVKLGAPWALENIFGAVWILFALLVIAANFNAVLLINEEKSKELERIKRAKKRAWEHRLEKAASGRIGRGARG
ncbi:hypothetical protein [Paenibacillus sp. NPDC058071]|uniref:hypothetical protein n=1 Tax=Paenibacillus sp. NPDC058071 TaxID=3346326 RepID=UPI0036DFA083